MLGSCSNYFILELSSKADRTLLSDAFEMDEKDPFRSPFHAIFEKNKIGFSCEIRWSGGYADRMKGSKTRCKGFISTGCLPIELIERLKELGWLVEWCYFSTETPMIGIYRADGNDEHERIDSENVSHETIMKWHSWCNGER